MAGAADATGPAAPTALPIACPTDPTATGASDARPAVDPTATGASDVPPAARNATIFAGTAARPYRRTTA